MGEHVFRTGVKFNSGGAAIEDVQIDLDTVFDNFVFDSIDTSDGRSVSWQFLIICEPTCAKSGIISATWTDDSGSDITVSSIIGECTAPDAPTFDSYVDNIEIALNGTDIEFRGDVLIRGGICKMIRTVM